VPSKSSWIAKSGCDIREHLPFGKMAGMSKHAISKFERLRKQTLRLILEEKQASDTAAASPEFIDRFADLLRKARQDAGLSIRELARRSGTDGTYLSRLERRLVPPPRWPTLAGIVAQVPLSELAKVVEKAGAGRLKYSVIEMADDLQKLIVSLPSASFRDRDWVSAVQTRLRKCMMLVKAAQDAS
jgi:transcriptional regulator with XRE-family HTH domain